MRKYVIVLILVLGLVLQGCTSGEKDSQETKTTDKAGPTITAAATSKPTVLPTVNPIVNSDLVLPITKNDTGKLLIQTVSTSLMYKNNSYIITSKSGESIVVDPTEMPRKSVVNINPAAIISTHIHEDHNDAIFMMAYKDAQSLLYTDGDIKTKDFHIYSVKASHGEDGIDGSNYLMVIEVDGLRIAHMGDIGQKKLTKDQLKKMGKIDIAFMQFDNSYSNMSVDNKKGFKLIEQVNPKIIITTHTSPDSEAMLKEKYGLKEIDNLMEISRDDLPDKNLNTYKILNKHKYS